MRPGGLYFDNFDDIQYPKNRPRVKDEWLQRLASPSWAGEVYTPIIDKTPDHPDRKAPTPVLDLLLTQAPDSGGTLRPVIVASRFDPDVRQANVPQGNSSDPRQFYNLVAGNLVPVGQSRIFDYPENGVVFAEGSIRVRGISGVDGVSPRPLTIVSGGTIYIEGNILQKRGSGAGYVSSASGWHVSLLAQDNVVLNPTAFTRITQTSGNVLAPAGDPDDLAVDGFYRIQPGSELDFAFTAASTTVDDYLLLLKHAGGDRTDATSETRVTLNLPSLAAPWPAGTDVYNWGAFPPPVTPPTYGPSPGPDYLFHEVSPGATLGWGETSWRYPDREQKAFFLNGMSARLAPGVDNTFRIQNNVSVAANDKDYLLGKVAIVPQNGPLPIRIEATMYAYTGSWFVIPPPFFNDHLDNMKQGDPYDTRAYMSNVTNPANTSQVREDPQTYPINMDVYPFYREPLNVEIEIVGSITENMPADPNERAIWTGHTWMQSGTYDPTAFPLTTPPPFRPNIRYRYDGDLRRLVRVRDVRSGQEIVAWAAPTSGRKPASIPTLQAAIGQVLTNNSYAVTLPLAPRLPASEVFYEGNPL
jgi:hypothetical protein